MTDKHIVLVTCCSRREARRIARILISEKLAACVNILSTPVESIYRWKGKIETAREFLLLVKTSRRHLPALERRVRALHSYDVPEILALPIAHGSAGYIAWLADSLTPRASTGRIRRRAKAAANAARRVPASAQSEE